MPSHTSLWRSSPGALAALLFLGLAVTAFALFAPGTRKATAGVDRCSAPEDITAFTTPLPRTEKRLSEGKQLTIVALGSSSTYGTGATKPENAYPNRLAALLQARFPDAQIRVVNRGVGGELLDEGLLNSRTSAFVQVAVPNYLIKLVLAVGQHDPDYVDAFYGPAAWKTEAARQKEKRAKKGSA